MPRTRDTKEKPMDIKQFIKENEQGMYDLLKELCLIPAPSNFEQDRAEYCKKWLENGNCTLSTR